MMAQPCAPVGHDGHSRAANKPLYEDIALTWSEFDYTCGGMAFLVDLYAACDLANVSIEMADVKGNKLASDGRKFGLGLESGDLAVILVGHLVS